MLEIMRENAGGWIVKILFAVIIFIFIFAFGMGDMDNSRDPVMATVNDQIITEAEFQEAFQRMAENVRNANPDLTPAQLQTPQFKQVVLGELINNKLLQAEAAALGVSASDEEIFAGISNQSFFKNQAGVFDSNVYQMAVRQLRMTPAQFEKNFKQELIAAKVKNLVRQSGAVTPDQARQIFNWVGEEARIDYIQVAPRDYVDSITVDEKEVAAFYEENKERFMVPAQIRLRYLSFTPADLAKYQTVTDEEIKAYYDANSSSMQQEEEVHARHILVKVNETDPDSVKTEAKNKIERVLKKAKAGEDFIVLAQKYSEGPSGPSGGDLGWFGRGAMVPAFEAAAFSTGKGEISEIIKTQFGWHIIKIEDRKEAKTQDLKDVRAELKEKIAREKAAESITDLLDLSMDRLVSGMKLDEVGDEVNMVAITSQPIPEQFLAQSFGLTPEAAKVVMDIPEGEAHNTPLAVDGGYILVEKVEDIPPTPMPLKQVQPSIINNIKARKAAEKAKAEAEKILKALTGPDAQAAAKKYTGRIMTSEAFDRQGNIPALGQDRKLAQAIFTAKDDAWLPTVYPLQTGIYIARMKELIPASDAAWEEQKELWIEQAGQNYEQEILTSFMTGLRENANIEITRPDLLN